VIDLENATDTHLFDAVKSQKIKASTTIKIIGNGEKSSKEGSVGLRWCEVSLKVPVTNRTSENATKLTSVKAWILKAPSKSKINAKSIEWTIVTNVPMETESEAIRAIGWYALRWRIELF
jgi:hypothetical protein